MSVHFIPMFPLFFVFFIFCVLLCVTSVCTLRLDLKLMTIAVCLMTMTLTVKSETRLFLQICCCTGLIIIVLWQWRECCLNHNAWVSEWVSSCLKAHQHNTGYSVPEMARMICIKSNEYYITNNYNNDVKMTLGLIDWSLLPVQPVKPA